jgi:ankyrin repeat protein
LFVCLFFFFFFSEKQNFPGENRAPCRPLLLAALKGDWPTAEALLSGNPDSVRARITKEGATVLHIAVIAQRTTFIEKLLIWIGDNQDALGSKTTSDYTALHYAAQSGIFRNAEKLVQKYPTPDHLPLIPNSNGDMPLNLAAYQGHAKIISYLLPKTPLDQLTPDNSTNLLNWTIQNDLYGN